MSGKKICFTIDVDCDAAWPLEGATHAVTKGHSKPLFDATQKGLVALTQLLDELHVNATFFFETRTAIELSKRLDLNNLMKSHEVGAHGFNHEDYTGEFTGMCWTREEKKCLLASSKNELQKIFPSHEIIGFRAPYLHADAELMELLHEVGFTYDSSFEEDNARKLSEPRGVKEIKISAGRDARGNKISGYLWQLMEGKRRAEEYIKLVQEAKQETSEPIVLATHSWHSHYSISRGALPQEQAKENVGKIRKLLCELKQKNEFKKTSEVIEFTK